MGIENVIDYYALKKNFHVEALTVLTTKLQEQRASYNLLSYLPKIPMSRDSK